MKKLASIFIVTALACWGCKQAYNPGPITAASNYLVVEGFLNTGADSTVVRLSRTVPPSSVTGTKPVLGAVVTMLGNTNNSYPVIETGNGYYKAPGLNLSTPGSYNLKMITTDGKVYQSDLVSAKNSPPIDSVYYRIQNNGVQIYADTHDPANNSRYYRWEFNETYDFHTPFSSNVYLQTTPMDTVLPRPLTDQIYRCWRTDNSTNILLNSSAKLAKDVIAQNRITFIPLSSEMLGDRYTIFVKQYTLTVNAYNYYQRLKKNTEQLGSIFDAQPSELPGNIHCTSNPSEPVVGYITAGTSTQARIFIDNRKLPPLETSTPYGQCMPIRALFKRPVGQGFVNDVAEYIYTGEYIPINIIEPPGTGIILGYTASSPFCVDCTLRGTNVKPSFWID